MQPLGIYNTITLSDVSVLPLPDDIKEVFKNTDLTEVLWNSIGFPVNGGKYSLVGKLLYFDGVEGNPTVEKEDFSGKAYVGSYLINPNKEEGQEDFNAWFKLSFCEGELRSVTVESIVRQSHAEFTQIAEKASLKLKKVLKNRASWWFKWLYRPYVYAVRGVGFVILVPCFLIEWSVNKIISFLTPL